MIRRAMWGIVASAAVLLPLHLEEAPYSQVSKAYVNTSSDGRVHTCGVITEDGVTEYLNAYIKRCGDTTLASDT